jgi:hypothetical protein
MLVWCAVKFLKNWLLIATKMSNKFSNYLIVSPFEQQMRLES